ESELHAVTIREVTQVNDSIRILRLDIPGLHAGITFTPGQFLDLYFESLEMAGRYAILSTPSAAAAAVPESLHPPHPPYVEVAIQHELTLETQRLWADTSSIVGTELKACVTGSFVWPSSNLHLDAKQRAVFLAGGIGVSALASMVSDMHESGTMPQEVHFLYTSRTKGYYTISNVLALESLLKIRKARPGQFHLYLFCSGHPSRSLMEDAVPRERFEPRRVLERDLLKIFGNEEVKLSTICYICGPPQMTE
ncbi:hypothetical protein GQ53DRAFT_615988, partial [Thozetella sp. PMI_491]